MPSIIKYGKLLKTISHEYLVVIGCYKRENLCCVLKTYFEFGVRRHKKFNTKLLLSIRAFINVVTSECFCGKNLQESQRLVLHNVW